MVIVYLVLVCSGFLLVWLLNMIIAASRKKRWKYEKEAQSYEMFVAHEEERQAEVREVILKHPK